MKERLEKILGRPVRAVVKLFGDASTRAYYRILQADGQTAVLMAMPEGNMSVSEEITNLKTPPAELPFINIQRYLASRRLPVPAILHFSPKDRWLILEDVGDVKLADVAAQASPEEKRKRYGEAIDLLIRLQREAAADPACVAFQRSFDATLFNWEFDHFWEYYFELHPGAAQPDPAETEQFRKETREITAELLKIPRVFTHRDYQSRNLMVRNGRLVMIDFQDALMGPRIYDLVALLRDSYVDVTPDLDFLLRRYCGRKNLPLEETDRFFHLQTVQRKLKDAGRFVFIAKVKKNPNFLPFIPVSLGYVRHALERLPEHENLFTLLKKYVKEWGPW